jgi:hypothetical protein
MTLPENPILAPFSQSSIAGPKRPYERPQLVVFGDLRTFTLGPSPGIGESGNPALFKSR